MKREALNRWAKPLMDALKELEDLARNHPGDASMLDRVEKKLAALPPPDPEPLAEDMALDMEQAAVDSIVAGVRKMQNVALFAPDDNSFGPLQEAIARLTKKTPILASLDSDAWSRMPLAFRERGQFSARVESYRVVSDIQKKLALSISQQRETLANGKERFVSRDSFIRDIRQAALDEGLDTGKGNVLTNIAAPRRIGLIYDMQNAQAAGHARWKLDNDKDALAIMPAWRLGASSAREPRPAGEWLAKWQEAGNAVGWKGAVRGQMVALKTSRIWMRLSTFGTPWPPFDWGSTRELEDVWRDEAEKLGLVKPDETVQPVAEQQFNAELHASVSDLSPARQQELKESFGDQVVIENGTARLKS